MTKLFLITAFMLTVWCVPAVSWTAEPAGSRQTAEEQKKARDEQSMEERFRKLGKSLDELNARAATMAEQTRKDIDRQLADAEKKRKVAGQKLEELKSEGEKKWHSFAAEVNAALDEFEKAYYRAKEHFKE